MPRANSLTSAQQYIQGAHSLEFSPLSLLVWHTPPPFPKGAGQISSTNIDALEMGKRLAVERELESLEDTLSTCKPAFDDSGNFLVRLNGIV